MFYASAQLDPNSQMVFISYDWPSAQLNQDPKKNFPGTTPCTSNQAILLLLFFKSILSIILTSFWKLLQMLGENRFSSFFLLSHILLEGKVSSCGSMWTVTKVHMCILHSFLTVLSRDSIQVVFTQNAKRSLFEFLCSACTRHLLHKCVPSSSDPDHSSDGTHCLGLAVEQNFSPWSVWWTTPAIVVWMRWKRMASGRGNLNCCGIFLHFPLSPHIKATRRNKIVEEIMSYNDF